MSIDHFFLNCCGVVHIARVNSIIVVILIDHNDIAVVKLSMILTVLYWSWRFHVANAGCVDLNYFGRSASHGISQLPSGDRLLPNVNVATIILLRFSCLCCHN